MQHPMRRKDRELSSEEAWRLLERGFCGRLATSGPDGWPYIRPLHYVVHNGAVHFHTSTARGHSRINLEADPRVCFEVDEPGPVFAIDHSSPCHTSGAFESVILFGTCHLVDDPDEKLAALRSLMAKYADPAWERPDVWPMLNATAVWRVEALRITGKRRTS